MIFPAQDGGEQEVQEGEQGEEEGEGNEAHQGRDGLADREYKVRWMLVMMIAMVIVTVMKLTKDEMGWLTENTR